MSCKHPNVRQAPKCQASIQMSGKHPTTRQKSDVRQSPDMPQCPEICHNATKYATMLPTYVTFWTNIFVFFLFRPKIAQKGPWGPWGPLGALFPPIFPPFPPIFPPYGGPLFSPLLALFGCCAVGSTSGAIYTGGSAKPC